MKIRVFDRLTAFIVALVLFLVTVFLLGVAWNIIKQPIIDEYLYSI
jgi:hypothetical protein